MTMKKMTALSAIVAGTLLAASQANAIISYQPVYQFPANLVGTTTAGNNGFLWGNIFQVNNNIQVGQVGAFDQGLDGFTIGVPVAIYSLTGSYDTGTWNKLSATEMTITGTQGSMVGSARMVNLPSAVTLTPGIYAVASIFQGTVAIPGWDYDVWSQTPSGPSPTFNGLSGFISQPASSTVDGNTAFVRFSVASLAPTINAATLLTQGNHGYGYVDYAGATFAAVPEASQFAMAGIGLLGLVYVGRSTPVRRWLKLA